MVNEVAFDTRLFNVERRSVEIHEMPHETCSGQSLCTTIDPNAGAADRRLGTSERLFFWRRDGIRTAENDRIPSSIPSPNRSFSEP